MQRGALHSLGAFLVLKSPPWRGFQCVQIVLMRYIFGQESNIVILDWVTTSHNSEHLLHLHICRFEGILRRKGTVQAQLEVPNA